jgi:hypothetical protein
VLRPTAPAPAVPQHCGIAWRAVYHLPPRDGAEGYGATLGAPQGRALIHHVCCRRRSLRHCARRHSHTPRVTGRLALTATGATWTGARAERTTGGEPDSSKWQMQVFWPETAAPVLTSAVSSDVQHGSRCAATGASLLLHFGNRAWECGWRDRPFTSGNGRLNIRGSL